MRLEEARGRLRGWLFRLSRFTWTLVGGGRMVAFGVGERRIGRILVINLDRKPDRLRRTMRELNRFKTADGVCLGHIAERLSAIDARNGRAVAATADVDHSYTLAHQLYVQPDPQLEACFGLDEHVMMTRQEVAVARSHVEVWKRIVAGDDDYVLVLEDDIWFRPGAARAIDRGWRAARDRQTENGAPHLVYFSYSDAGGTASRKDECEALFRPERGLWFLSGYVLSREGAGTLLRAMPVVGPVDMWMNFRFAEMEALALAEPAILQRCDQTSDNVYSVLPFLARAGIVDAETVREPPAPDAGPVLVWTKQGQHEGLAMALSVLGLKVRVFDGDEDALTRQDLKCLFDAFNVLVDAPLDPGAFSAAIGELDARFILEAGYRPLGAIDVGLIPPGRTVVLADEDVRDLGWGPICDLIGLDAPAELFPLGTPRSWRLFRHDRCSAGQDCRKARWFGQMDVTPWTLPIIDDQPAASCGRRSAKSFDHLVLKASMTFPSLELPGRSETFPGNLAAFTAEGLVHDREGARLILDRTQVGDRPYRSGAFSSSLAFTHGRFEAEIKAATGSGLVTGFFLHRDAPRQEIDIEITGDDPWSMLVNVYFNPGDDGTALGFGYRGSPCRIDLGFDATADFHRYAIEWESDVIRWIVDGIVVHERSSWNPTPIPHLEMRLHGNLWAPRSQELAGLVDDLRLPTFAIFRNISCWGDEPTGVEQKKARLLPV